jgi:hypothetical protein
VGGAAQERWVSCLPDDDVNHVDLFFEVYMPDVIYN